jgi:hypothetical protein
LRNYFDLFRAAAGSLALMYWSFEVEPDGPSQSVILMIILQTGVLALAMLAQTLRWENRLMLFAPVFYFAGLSVGICGYESAILGATTAWALHALLPSPSVFLFTQCCAITGFSALFNGSTSKLTLLTFAIGMIPTLLSLTTGKPIAVINRKR